MLPTMTAARIFPAPRERYTQHLGENQARAFALLWDIVEAPDPLTDADGAAWEIHRALRTNDGITIAPPDVQRELFEALRQVEIAYPKGATALDIEYAGLFLAIAGWQHEILPGNIDSFVAAIAE